MRKPLTILLMLALAAGTLSPLVLASADDEPEDSDAQGSDGAEDAAEDACLDEPEAACPAEDGDEDAPETCEEDEVFDADRMKCRKAKDDDKDDEAEDVEKAARKAEKAAEKEREHRECEDLDDASNETVAACGEDDESGSDEERDPPKCKRQAKCEGLDEDDEASEVAIERSHGRRGDCMRRELQYERRETLENGTVVREKIREGIVDCPGEERDRHDIKVKYRRYVRAADSDSADVVIDKAEKINVKVKLRGVEARDLNLTMTDNASVFSAKEPRGNGPALKVDFLEILEFEDGDGDGAYDLDDVVLRTWRIRDLATDATSDNDSLVVSYELPPGGVLSFVFDANETERAKFDVRIRGFAYSTDTSQLALRAAFAAKNAAYHRLNGNPALVTEANGRLGYFDWVDGIEADGDSARVEATVYVGDGGAAGTAQLYLSYPHADEIVHDPSIGFMAVQSVAVVKEALAHPVAFGAAAVAALAFVGAGYALRRKP